jgi:predicted metalloprotease with PDZ domain
LQCKDWESGVVTDVRCKSQAIKLGIAPGMRISAIDGKRFSKAILANAIKDKGDHEITIIPVEIKETVVKKTIL